MSIMLKLSIVFLATLLLSGCAAVPFGIGLIPGAPAYLSSVIGNGQSAYEVAMDERTTEQQMLDAIIEGHAQAELYKHKEIRNDQITAYSYFGKLYLVGEYDSQEQLRTIYECVDKVENKRAVISRLYLKEDKPEKSFLERKTMEAELATQLMADFEVTSSPVRVEVVQGDIVLLGVIADREERDKIMAHALSTHGVNRVISYLYHQENGGPEPRIMTAQLPPSKATAPKRRKPSRNRRPQTMNDASPEKHIMAVNNPDRGR